MPDLIDLRLRPLVPTPEQALQEQSARLQIGEQTRQLREQGQIRAILARYGGDIEKATPEIMSVSPELGLKFQTASMQSKRAVLEAQDADLEHQAKQFEILGRLVPKDEHDDTGYQTWRQTAVSLKVPNAEKLPFHYDDQAKAAVAHIRQLATPVTQQLADQRARIDEERKRLDTAEDNRRQAEALKETQRHNETTEQRQHEQVMAQIANIGADNQRQAAQAAETARHNQAMERIGMIQATKEPAGQKPRNVTSGDANRLAEMTSALTDLKGLGQQLTAAPNTTGFGSKVGAILPNVVTEYTGVGQEAKQKQALIDLVKQIVGKSLEGGVLRKEDEIKYAKILPTIGDPPEVVAAKLKGLDQTITQKREDLMSSLEDAGYDVSRYRQRTPSAPAPKPTGGGSPDGWIDLGGGVRVRKKP